MAEVVERRERVTFREAARRAIRYENATLGIILAAIMAGFAGATGGKTIRINNLKMVLVQGATMGIAGIGQSFTILTKGIDLSPAGVAFGTSAIGASMMTTQMWQNKFFSYPVPIYVGIPLMMLFGIGFGAISGLLVSRIGIPPLIATLGVWQIAYGTGFLVTGGFTITRMVKPLTFFGQGFLAKQFFGGFPVAGIIWIVVGIITYFVVHHTSYGRAVFATGGNPVMAWLSGVNVKNTQLSVYIISAVLATLGGLIRLARVMSLSESSYIGLELQSIASAVVGGTSLAGGKGSIVGVVLGGLIISVILNGQTVLNADPFTESMTMGLLVVTAVAVDFWRRGGR